MKKILITLAAIGLSGLSASAVFAATDFATLDADDNDQLSISDIQMGYPGFTQDQFIKLDIDGNGTLNESEFAGVASLGLEGVDGPLAVEGAMGAEVTGSVTAPSSTWTFLDLDQDDDDKLTLAEALQAWPELTQAEFDAADLDKDMFLNNTEYEALANS